MAVSFDLFGTLVAVEMPDDPASALARELRERGVAVPSDFGDAYRERHVHAPAETEVPLPDHVGAALASRGTVVPDSVVRRAVADAFDPTVRRRDGASDALQSATARGPIGLCSNCSVPGLVRRTLVRTDLIGSFDAVVTSVDCGWRKPDRRAFDALADRLDVPTATILHVGDDRDTDGGIESAGGTFVDVAKTPLSEFPQLLESKP